MTTHYIEPAHFYILSGVSGSGKSHLLSKLIERGQIDASSIVCPDTIRKNILGTAPRLDKYGIYTYLPGWDSANKEAFEIAYKTLELRFKHNLITFFDATSLDDKARQPLVELAAQWGMRSTVIIFDVELEKAKTNFLSRAERFAPEVLEKQYEKFQKTSAMPYILYKPQVDEIVLTPRLITTADIDIIGDTHGLLEDTLTLLNQFGWSLDKKTNTLSHTNAHRRILFVGDVVDRGPHSWELLDIVRSTVEKGLAYFVMGNHEHKLYRLINDYERGVPLEKKSLAGALSFKKYLTLSPEKQKEFYKFLKFAPNYYSLWYCTKENKVLDKSEVAQLIQNHTLSHVQKFGFAHADLQIFHDYLNPRQNVLYGVKERLADNTLVNNDVRYDEFYKEGLNSHIYVRGHLPLKENAEYVFSLDDKCAFAGHIKCLNFSNYLNDFKENHHTTSQKLFELNTKNMKISFNFNDYLKTIDIDKETDLSGIVKPKKKKEQDNKQRKKP